MPTDSDQQADNPQTSIDAAIAADDMVQVYLRQATQEPLLTRQQEVKLARCIYQGRQAAQRLPAGKGSAQQVAEWQEQVEAGKAARERFIRANIRLVIHIAKAYQGQGCTSSNKLDTIFRGDIGDNLSKKATFSLHLLACPDNLTTYRSDPAAAAY